MFSCENCEKYQEFKFCPDCGKKNNIFDKENNKIKSNKQSNILDIQIYNKNEQLGCKGTTDSNWGIYGKFYGEKYTIREFIYYNFYFDDKNLIKFEIYNGTSLIKDLSEILNIKILELDKIILYYDNLKHKSVFTYYEIVQKYKKENYIFGIDNIFTETHVCQNITFKFMKNEIITYLKNFHKFTEIKPKLSLKVSPIEALTMMFEFVEIPEEF